MSYDLVFVHREGDEPWDAATRVDAQRGSPLAPHRLAEWDRIVVRAREVLGDAIVLAEADAGRLLTHEATGLQVEAYGDVVVIHVPDAAGPRVHDLARRLGDAVIAETGLEGYDPQLGSPLRRGPGGAGESATDTPIADRIADTLASDDLRRSLRDAERAVRGLLERFGL